MKYHHVALFKFQAVRKLPTALFILDPDCSAEMLGVEVRPPGSSEYGQSRQYGQKGCLGRRPSVCPVSVDSRRRKPQENPA